MTKTHKADALLRLAAQWQHGGSPYAGGGMCEWLRWEFIWTNLPSCEMHSTDYALDIWASAALSEVAGMGIDFE